MFRRGSGSTAGPLGQHGNATRIGSVADIHTTAEARSVLSIACSEHSSVLGESNGL